MKAKRMALIFTAALTRLAADGETFDLVFCDPPYGKGLWERALTAIDGSSLLSEGALVIVESGEDERTIPTLSRLSLVREERYGHTTRLRFFENAGAQLEDE